MKRSPAGVAALLFLSNVLFAQRECKTAEYEQQYLMSHSLSGQGKLSIENYTVQYQSNTSSNPDYRTSYTSVITIPVVVHILYHTSGENISNEQIQSQIDVLNRDFRKRNSDTSNIPFGFKAFAADCEIEFKLAAVDPRARATSGIVRKYTPVAQWVMDDKIKYSAETGDDAWDSKNYLNIWIGNVHSLKGYSTFPGAPGEKDGIVLNTNSIGGRTLVHEAGHWLGLKHIWGDADCGDDMVDDTPKQRGFTPGCPSTVRITCSNAPLGNMYMNYMDFTNDACLNMFTYGQKQRMRSLFVPGGARYSILSSNAFGEATTDEIIQAETMPQWLQVKLYPNPSTTDITINFEYDARWKGKEILIANVTGQIELRLIISSNLQRINVSKLKPGFYFIKTEKNGEKVMQKFVKM